MQLKRFDLIQLTGLKLLSGKSVETLGVGSFVAPALYVGLKHIAQLVEKEGGEFYINSLYRDFATQDKLRKEYEAGLRAPANRPGESFHGAARAADINVSTLNFKGVPKDKWLQKFWDLAIPLGFRPNVKTPDLSLPECWHFDVLGEMNHLPEVLGYAEAAKACTIDAGLWDPNEDSIKLKKMFIQVQLHRLRFNVGKVDGDIGPKTNAALKILNLDKIPVDDIVNALLKL
jgi:hypothetical protein